MSSLMGTEVLGSIIAEARTGGKKTLLSGWDAGKSSCVSGVRGVRVQDIMVERKVYISEDPFD